MFWSDTAAVQHVKQLLYCVVVMHETGEPFVINYEVHQ